MSNPKIIGNAVANLYNIYPFPPEPLLDKIPPGYNWRWHWTSAYSFCTGEKPSSCNIRILDAGCGTGVGTEYLVHLNPKAYVVGIDISSGALEVARKRCQLSGADRVEFHHLSLFDVDKINGEFDLINCVGVLHHTPDPIGGIKALANKLRPGGLLHVFVYSELGRWEIQLMQKAIAILQVNKRGDYRDGVQVGRKIFASLPSNNRLVQYEKRRWAMENMRDEYFADMYVHPQEIDYNVESLFELIDASGLDFVGFSNSGYWNIERLLGQAPDLVKRTNELSDRQLYRLIELLDPEISHYEFFLSHPPLNKNTWSNDNVLMQSIPERHPCMEGWPSKSIFDYNYHVVQLSDEEFQFLQACDCKSTVAEILTNVKLNLDEVKNLQKKQVLSYFRIPFHLTKDFQMKDLDFHSYKQI